MKLSDEATSLLVGSRKNKNITLQEAGAIVGVDRTTYSRYEKNNFENLSPAALSPLCQALGVSLFSVLFEKTEPLNIDAIFSDLLLFLGYFLSLEADGSYTLKAGSGSNAPALSLSKNEREALQEKVLSYIDFEINHLFKK